jgi:hypothetical protein
MSYEYKTLILIMFLFLITISLIKYSFSDDRWYLYKYSKLYNSYKFETTRPQPTETDIDSKSCLEIAANNNPLDYTLFKACGKNIINEETFKNLIDNEKIDFKIKNNLVKLCNPGFKTLDGSYIACNYEQKRKLFAVLLEITGLGLGHYYIGKYLFFFAKFLTFYLFCYMIVCVIFFVGAINESNVSPETSKRSTKIVKIIFPLIYFWWILDIIVFSAGMYTDDNDQELY